MHGIPPIAALLPILFDEYACIQHLFQIGALYRERSCPESGCGSAMIYYPSQSAFVCPKKVCRKKIGFKANSFFAGCRLQCCQIMHLAYLWLSKARPSGAETQTGHTRETICEYYRFFRQLISSNPIIEDSVIGGEGIIVELDESKLGKRKYNRGHHVEGVWILGGVERTAERKTFFLPVENRSAETLLPIIATHVLPGSIVYTDLWRGYSRIQEELFLMHFTVNHSETFVDPVTGVHTNSIEGTWNGLKMSISPRSRVREGMEGHIAEFQWRRQHKSDRWDAFLALLRDTYYE